MNTLMSLLSGLIFGLGLIVSGMSNPAKIQNFLDLAGLWDPSLIFVMGGAIAITAPGFWLLRKRSAPFFGPAFHWPTRQDLDGRLLAGAALFGIGWGVSGYCPGPALTGLPMLANGTLVVILGMLVGMVLANWFGSRLPVRPAAGVT